jgi:XRE family transcriptional regulator, aerobic/anaerobic benzoate catabolism transcriptional regulator
MATKIIPTQTAPSQTADEGFLAGLGRRVRELRNRRGTTRKTLALEADVSERHLAQLETGDGNISVLLLQRIAEALGVSIAEFFAEPMRPSALAGTATHAETSAVIQLLERLPANRRREIADRLRGEVEHIADTRAGRIALIGLRGAGKTTLGGRLASDIDAPFVELDREIEADAGMNLAEIFSLYGQAGYRRLEKRTLDRVLAANPRAIISVGGGVVSERDTYERLLASCFTVWVKAHPEEHMARVVAQGDLRAMADNDAAMEDLRDILAAREPLYGMADFQLETSGDSVDQSFTKLKRAISAR